MIEFIEICKKKHHLLLINWSLLSTEAFKGIWTGDDSLFYSLNQYNLNIIKK